VQKYTSSVHSIANDTIVGRQERRSVYISKGLAPQPTAHKHDEEYLPLYVALDRDVLSSGNLLTYAEALRAGLKALKVLGVTGIAVDVFWGLVEGREPGVYNWSGYKNLLRIITDMGFKVKVSLCFHSTELVSLPEWILEEGRVNPDIYYTDKAGGRNTECLSLGINDVPVLKGRSAITVYTSFMKSFKDEFSTWFGGLITECLIGLGPNGELKYPAHPSDKRWNFPGVGEFQCYDKFMLATLKACAEQVGQPSWGLGGPHDAGSYCLWPHQTGFFHHHGNWDTPYGKFFLQWYAEMLVRHADGVLGAAREVFASTPVSIAVRAPGVHWWYNTASHAPELTAGYYNTVSRDGYLPMFKVLAHHGVALRLALAELRNNEQPPQAFCDPEKLLTQQRTVAAALQLPVTLENRLMRFDDPALARLESLVFDPLQYQGVELPQPSGVTFCGMGDAMFEPANWKSFKSFVSRLRDRADKVGVRPRGASQSSMDVDGPSARATSSVDAPNRGRPAFA